MQSLVLMARKDPSVLALVAANLVPLVGFLFFGWPLLSLFFIYWVESVIIGLYNIFKILIAGLYAASIADRKTLKQFLLPFVYIPFFCFHFFGVLGGVLLGIFTLADIPQSLLQSTFLHELANVSVIAVAAFVLSHGISFITNFIGKKEYKKRPELYLFLPYVRIFVMMLAVFFGGMLTLGNFIPGVYAVLFVLFKIYADLLAHKRVHSRRPAWTHGSGAIELDGSSWKRPDDFYDAFFAAVGAPSWHGRSLDALHDSIVEGRINRTDFPYNVRITGSSAWSSSRSEIQGLPEFIEKVSELFREANEQNGTSATFEVLP